MRVNPSINLPVGAIAWRLIVDLAIIIVAVVLVITAMGRTNAARRLADQRLMQAQASQRDADDQRALVAERSRQLDALGQQLAESVQQLEQTSNEKHALQTELTSTQQGAVQMQESLKAEQTLAKTRLRDVSIYFSAIEGLLSAPAWTQSTPSQTKMADVVASGVKRMSQTGRGPGTAVAQGKVLMADKLLDAGESTAALPLLQEAVANLEKAAGENDPKTVAARVRLARAQINLGEASTAVETLQQALESCKTNAEANKSNQIAANRLLLDSLIEAGRFAEAEPLAREFAGLPAPGRPIQPGKRRLAMEYLMPVLDGLQKHEDAERVIRQIIDDVSTETVHTTLGFQLRCYLARALLGQNKLDELAALESELNQTASFLLAIETPLAPGLFGQIQMRRGNHEAAERSFRTALLAEPAEDGQDIRRTELLKSIIQLYESSGKAEQAGHYRRLLPGPSSGDSSAAH
jgi:tetratricopeptide (TPR) repeat protein